MFSKRKRSGQSMVEYALGLGCVAALCMVALGNVGLICSKIMHTWEHAVNYGGQISGHAHPIVNPSAQPWVID